MRLVVDALIMHWRSAAGTMGQSTNILVYSFNKMETLLWMYQQIISGLLG